MGSYSVRLAALLLIFLLQVSCGGGGGGGGGDSTDGSTGGDSSAASGLEYKGSRVAATLSDDSALAWGSRFINTRSMVSIAESFWVDVPPAPEVKAGTETVEGSQGGSVEIDVSVVSGSNVRVESVFSNYRADGITLSGTIIQLRKSSATSDYTALALSNVLGSMEFQAFRISSSDFDISINGMVEGKASDKTTLIANLMVADNLSSQSTYFEDLNLILEQELIAYEQIVMTSISGRIYDSVEGVVTVNTVEPFANIRYEDAFGGLIADAGGLVEINGAGSPLRLAPISRRYISLLRDVQDDGAFERALRVSWEELNGASLEGHVDRGRPPIANAGAELQGPVDAVIHLHGLFSHDEDRRFLTHRWRVTAAPMGSIYSNFETLSAQLDFEPDLEGDYFFTLEVDDGEGRYQSSTKIVVAGNSWDNMSPIRTEPAIELLPPDAGQIDYELMGVRGGSGSEVVESESVFWQMDKPFSSGSSARLYNYSGSFSNYLNPDEDLGEYLSISILSEYHSSTLSFTEGGAPFDFSAIHGGRYSDSVHFSDIDGDGIEDFVMLTSNDDYVDYLEYWHGQDGTYIRASDVNIFGVDSEASATHMAVGDLNGDGKADTVVSPDAKSVLVYFYQPEGGYSEPQNLSFADQSCGSWPNPNKVFIEDFDGDGLSDLFALSGCTGKLEIWLQVPDSGLVQRSPVDLGYPNSISFAQVDGDGKVDVARGYGADPGVAEILLNKGNSFESLVKFENTQLHNAPAVLLEDFSNDNRTDLIQFDGDRVLFYTQNQDGVFELSDSVESPESYGGGDTNGVVADVDGDGDLDLTVTHWYSLTQFLNAGDNTFKAINFGSVLENPSPKMFSVTDFNVDGHKDIILPNRMLEVRLGGIRPFPQSAQ